MSRQPTRRQRDPGLNAAIEAAGGVRPLARVKLSSCNAFLKAAKMNGKFE
jgi:hypothetical protein